MSEDNFAGCIRCGIRVAFPSQSEELIEAQVKYFSVKRTERPNDRQWDDYLICRAMGYGRENIADEGPFKR